MTTTSKTLALITATLMGGLLATHAEDRAVRGPEATASEIIGSFRDIPALEPAFLDTSPEQLL